MVSKIVTPHFSCKSWKFLSISYCFGILRHLMSILSFVKTKRFTFFWTFCNFNVRKLFSSSKKFQLIFQRIFHVEHVESSLFSKNFKNGFCSYIHIFIEISSYCRYCMKIPHLRFPNFLCWVCNARSNAENYEQIKTLKRRKLRAHSCNWRRTMHQVKRKLLCLLKVSELLAFNFQSKLHLFTSCCFYTCSSREMMRRLTCLFAAFFSKHRLQLIIEVWVHCFPCCIK